MSNFKISKKSRYVAGALLAGTVLPMLSSTAAFAATQSWDTLDASAEPQVATGGYQITGITTGTGVTFAAGFHNLDARAPYGYHSWCIISGAREAKDASTLDTALDKGNTSAEDWSLIKYATSMYGNTTDGDTAAAVSYIVHAYGDQGNDWLFTKEGQTGGVSANDRRAAWRDAYDDAPAGVKAKIDQITNEARNYVEPNTKAGATLTNIDDVTAEAKITPIAADKPVVATLSGDATFENGTQTMEVSAETTVKVIQGGQGGKITLSVQPKNPGTVKVPATKLSNYWTAGVPDGSPTPGYQIMVWSAPEEKPLEGATAELELPRLQPELHTKAAAQVDGSKTLAYGTVLDDIVDYKYLKKNTDYVLKGTINISYNGGAEQGAPIPVEAETKFNTGDSMNGTAKVQFTIPPNENLLDPNGFDVAYEGLYEADGVTKVLNLDGQPVEHKDPNSEEQSFHVVYPTNLSAKTVALDKLDSDKKVWAGTSVIDTVTQDGLVPNGSYSTTATLVDANGTVVDGVTGTASAQADANGVFKAEVKLDIPKDLKEGQYTVFEVIKDKYDTVVVRHESITDTEQTFNVVAPTVGTELLDTSDQDDHYFHLEGGEVTDKVALGNLNVGQEYTVKGWLMEVELDDTGKPVENPDGSWKVKKIEGTDGETTFTSTSTDANIDVKMKAPAGLANKYTVAYEELYWNGELRGEHKDPKNPNQRVTTPKVKTTLLDVVDNDKFLIQKGGAVKDTVQLNNLKVGEKYTAKGWLVELVKDDKGNLVLDDKGEPTYKKIEGSEGQIDFTAKAADDTADVPLTVPEGYAGKDIVAFEELYANGKLVGDHKDPKDENQKVYVPNLGTTASDELDGNKELAQTGAVAIDELKYTNLAPGQEYTAVARLIDKATGEPMLDDNGKPITVTHKFTPSAKDGSEKLSMVIPNAAAGKTGVFFEEVYNREGVLVVEHEDINNPDQTVYVADLHTNLFDSKDGDKYSQSADGELTDRISFTNLTVGQKYTVKGVLMVQPDGTVSIKEQGSQSLDAATETATKVEGTEVAKPKEAAASDAGDQTATATPTAEAPKPTAEPVSSDIEAKAKATADAGTLPAAETTAPDAKEGNTDATGTSDATGTGVSDKGTVALDDPAATKVTNADGTITVTKGEFSTTWSKDGQFVRETRTVKNGAIDPTIPVIALDDPAAKVTKHEDGTVTVTKDGVSTDYDDKGNVIGQGIIEGSKALTSTGVDLSEWGIDPAKLGKDGSVLLGKDGKPVSVSYTFTASQRNGSVDAKFELPEGVSGLKLVAFETLYDENGNIIGRHHDLSSATQTIGVSKIGTTAADAADKDKKVYSGGKLIDTIQYTNVNKGEYKAVAKVYDKKAGKLTNIVAEQKVHLEAEGEGTFDVTIPIPADQAPGDYVVYEYLYDASGKLITTHENPNDEGQSFVVETPPVPVVNTPVGALPRTGASVLSTGMLAGAMLAGGVVAAGMARVRRSGSKVKADTFEI